MLATGNRHKAREFADIVGCPLATLADCGFSAEPEETGDSYAENALIKARHAAALVDRWALADDTGLEVEGLGGAPGVHTARYAGPNATAAENRTRLLASLSGVDGNARRARFVCHLCLVKPDGSIVATATGQCAGRIRRSTLGDLGFGYDPLFEVVEYHCTMAEIGPVAKSVLSHRARAMQMLAAIAGLPF